ncbi:MAG: hypothetical protein MMC33_005358 [Icmadophila ericetorum]|nr:hypothetical protein [Icmadophila ericetorum]
MTGPIYNVGSVGRYPQQYPPQDRAPQYNLQEHPLESPTSTLYSEQKVTTVQEGPSGARRFFAFFTAFLFFAATAMLILIQIGSLSNKHVLTEIYFFKMDLSHIVASDSQKHIHSRDVATSAGLHDFYQVGMWNFCTGNYPKGITECSKPKLMFWFNPVQTIISELKKGASVEFASDQNRYVDLIRKASHFTFGAFFATTFSSFLLVFLSPITLRSRLAAVPIALLSFCSGMTTFLAAAVTTAQWAVIHNEIEKNINTVIPTIGKMAFIFMWVAAACSLFGAFIQLGMCCCCGPRHTTRIVEVDRTGSRSSSRSSHRRVGRKERFEGGAGPNGEDVHENPALRRRWWGNAGQ